MNHTDRIIRIATLLALLLIAARLWLNPTYEVSADYLHWTQEVGCFGKIRAGWEPIGATSNGTMPAPCTVIIRRRTN